MDLSRIPEPYRARVEREMEAAADRALSAVPSDMTTRARQEVAEQARTAVLARYLKTADEADAAADAVLREYGVRDDGTTLLAAARERAEVWRKAFGEADESAAVRDPSHPAHEAVHGRAEPAAPGEEDIDIGLAYARRCSTAALLQVLVERADADGDTDATGEELAAVESARKALASRSARIRETGADSLRDLGLTLLPRVVRELASRRIVDRDTKARFEKAARLLQDERAKPLPCGHEVGDLIGGTETGPDGKERPSVTKCGACLALRQPEIIAAREKREAQRKADAAALVTAEELAEVAALAEDGAHVERTPETLEDALFAAWQAAQRAGMLAGSAGDLARARRIAVAFSGLGSVLAEVQRERLDALPGEV